MITKLRRMTDTPEACADIHQDLDRLDSWAERNLMRSCTWGGITSRTYASWG